MKQIIVIKEKISSQLIQVFCLDLQRNTRFDINKTPIYHQIGICSSNVVTPSEGWIQEMRKQEQVMISFIKQMEQLREIIKPHLLRKSQQFFHATLHRWLDEWPPLIRIAAKHLLEKAENHTVPFQ